jgi:hypothetical protein
VPRVEEEHKGPRCVTCIFWQEFDGCEEPLLSAGQCHRYPPKRIKAYRADPEVYEHAWTVGADWCGEHPDFPAYIASLKTKDDDPRQEDPRWLMRLGLTPRPPLEPHI